MRKTVIYSVTLSGAVLGALATGDLAYRYLDRSHMPPLPQQEAAAMPAEPARDRREASAPAEAPLIASASEGAGEWSQMFDPASSIASVPAAASIPGDVADGLSIRRAAEQVKAKVADIAPEPSRPLPLARPPQSAGRAATGPALSLVPRDLPPVGPAGVSAAVGTSRGGTVGALFGSGREGRSLINGSARPVGSLASGVLGSTAGTGGGGSAVDGGSASGGDMGGSVSDAASSASGSVSDAVGGAVSDVGSAVGGALN